MDLLFSYKGGDKNMDNVLLYFSLKHEGDFKKIYESLKAKEPVDENEFIKLKMVMSKCFSCLEYLRDEDFAVREEKNGTFYWRS